MIIVLAWTTAAVDNTRVVGAVPMVLDILNLRPVSDPLSPGLVGERENFAFDRI